MGKKYNTGRRRHKKLQQQCIYMLGWFIVVA